MGTDLWYFPKLVHYDFSQTDNSQADHFLVAEDFSNLKGLIEWLRANDNIAQQVSQNATKFYNQHLSKVALMEYVSEQLNGSPFS